VSETNISPDGTRDGRDRRAFGADDRARDRARVFVLGRHASANRGLAQVNRDLESLAIHDATTRRSQTHDRCKERNARETRGKRESFA